MRGILGKAAARLGQPLLVVVMAVLVAGAARGEHVVPEFVEGGTGNHTCDDFQGAEDWVELKVDPPGAGTFTDGTATVTITNFDGKRFDWSSDVAMDAVFVKAGAAGSYLYRYAPEATSDTRLQSPEEEGNAISHISFCYDAEENGGGGGGQTATPALDSQASTNGDVAPGDEVTDTVFVTSTADFPEPTGTVTFYLCGPAEATATGCPGGQKVGASKTLVGGQATSDPASPTADGRHCWRTTYSGDGVYAGASHTNGDTECFNVARHPTLTVVVSQPGGDIALGTSVHASASVTASLGGAITGSVRFYLCGPDEATGSGCASGGVAIGDAVTVQAGGAVSISIEADVLGRHCWRAEYGGSTVHLGSQGTDGDGACFVVKQAATLLSVSVPASGEGALGAVVDVVVVVSGAVRAETAAEVAQQLQARLSAALHAELHVSASAAAAAVADLQGVAAEATARVQATGAVRFYLCGPGEVTPLGCPTGGTLVGSAKALLAGTAASDVASGLAPGTYCWRAEYGGDERHLPASHTNADTECFVVLGVQLAHLDTIAADAPRPRAARPLDGRA